MKWHTLIATWFGSGKSKFAPGTIGSLATLPFAYAIHVTVGWHGLFIAAVFFFTIGCIATRNYLKHETDNPDPKEVVIDEVAGQTLALTFFTPTITGYVLGFLLFRVFDVMKPWPISWADKNVKGAIGVMLDDILAGIAVMFLPIIGIFVLYDYTETHTLLTELHPIIDAYVP